MTLANKEDRRIFQVEKLPESDVIQVDSETCVGCRTCELMCALHHEGVFSLSSARLYVSRDPFTASFVPEVCRHCLAPECYVVCPIEGAMKIDVKTGARQIIETRCIGCGACARACPWNEAMHIIRFNPEKKIYFKCDLCGGDPRCVDACPVEALTYLPKTGGT